MNPPRFLAISLFAVVDIQMWSRRRRGHRGGGFDGIFWFSFTGVGCRGVASPGPGGGSPPDRAV